MKVLVTDIRKAIDSYHSARSIFQRLTTQVDPFILHLTSLLEGLVRHPQNLPLDICDFFNLCKILLSNKPADPRAEKSWQQLVDCIGQERFEGLQCLHSNGMYHAVYFKMAVDRSGTEFPIAWRFADKYFCKVIDLLTRAGFLTDKLTDWLVRLKSHKVRYLCSVLTLLDQRRILNVTFLTLFFGKSALLWKAIIKLSDSVNCSLKHFCCQLLRCSAEDGRRRIKVSQTNFR